MTVRELVMKLMEEAPHIDAEIYISMEHVTDTKDLDEFAIIRIDNDGMNDGINIDLKQIH